MYDNLAYFNVVTISRVLETRDNDVASIGANTDVNDTMRNVYETLCFHSTNSYQDKYYSDLTQDYNDFAKILDDLVQTGNVKLPVMENNVISLKGGHRRGIKGGNERKYEVVDFIALLLKYMIYGLIILVIIVAVIMIYKHYVKRKNMTLLKL